MEVKNQPYQIVCFKGIICFGINTLQTGGAEERLKRRLSETPLREIGRIQQVWMYPSVVVYLEIVLQRAFKARPCR